VLIGHGDAEAAYTAPLGSHERIIDLSGKLSLAETFRAIANAQLVVTNDSAPLHFALSSRVKLVGLFGPTRAETYVPLGRADVVGASVSLYCSPCVHHWEPPPCDGDNQCMKRLTVTQVLARCCELLDMAPGPVRPGDDAANQLIQSSYYPGLVYRRPNRD
jgi:heptosyltransferase-2